MAKALREAVTPEVIESILRKGHSHYKRGYELNKHMPALQNCPLGTVFVNRAGDLCVFTGIDPNIRKTPVMYTRVADRQPKMTDRAMLLKIAEAAAESVG